MEPSSTPPKMTTPLLNKGPKPRECGCKGIRSCKLCNSQFTGKESGENNVQSETSLTVFYYNPHTKDVCLLKKEDSNEVNTLMENSDTALSLTDGGFSGIDIIEDFVSEKEEQDLVSEIMATPFVNSQSGRRKQDYGPKVNFKRQKVKAASFNGLPSYSEFLYERMKSHPCLRGFEPVELCNLEYCETRGAHIDSHFDDWWLWGERLVTLNLLSDSTLTFTKDSKPSVQVCVPLKQRSLIVVAGPARYEWKHAILSEHVTEKRIAMTFRELSKEFQKGGERECDGLELLKLALTFQGIAIGS